MTRKMVSGEHEVAHPNIEPHVFSNGGKRILNHIMCGNAFPPMNTMK